MSNAGKLPSRERQAIASGRALLKAFPGYTVARLRFADGSQLWTFPALTARQADLLGAPNFPAPQTVEFALLRLSRCKN